MNPRRAFLGACASSVFALGVARVARSAQSELKFDEIYSRQGVLGMELSPRTGALAGKPVRMLGYAAPPLKAEAAFLVVTRAPVSICPFCNSDADWPADIVVVYPRDRDEAVPGGVPVQIDGTLELGRKVDAATGFLSLVRIVDATVKPLR